MKKAHITIKHDDKILVRLSSAYVAKGNATRKTFTGKTQADVLDYLKANNVVRVSLVDVESLQFQPAAHNIIMMLESTDIIYGDDDKNDPDTSEYQEQYYADEG